MLCKRFVKTLKHNAFDENDPTPVIKLTIKYSFDYFSSRLIRSFSLEYVLFLFFLIDNVDRFSPSPPRLGRRLTPDDTDSRGGGGGTWSFV